MFKHLHHVVVSGLLILACFAANSPHRAGAEQPAAKSQSEAVEPTKEMQRIARLTVANELLRLHWTTWVTGQELREIAGDSAKGINEQLEIRPVAEFLLPTVKAKPQRLSDFEKEAIADIRAGVAEMWHGTSGSIQYVRGIRATVTCIQCHDPIGAPHGELNEGDLLGIISLKLIP